MMHGLVLRTLQVFVQDTYGTASWLRIAELAGLETPGFEAMLHYEPSLMQAVLKAATEELDKPREVILEDVGTYLVSHPNSERLRRLLRFGGVDYIEFLHSLDDLSERTRLAVSDLILPGLEVTEHSVTNFSLSVDGFWPGFGHVLVGLLRAMADDYGALVLLDYRGQVGTHETIDITVVQTDFTEGREFDLASSVPERTPA